MDIYTPSLVPGHSRRANRWTRARIDQPSEEVGKICSVKDVALAVKSIVSMAVPPIPPQPPTTFLDVLREWDNIWMWDSIRWYGDDGWLAEAIADNSLMAVTDGSYIRERYPNINSACFVFVCTKGRGRLIGSFPEQTLAACAYRGELLGLLAIHLILLSVNKIQPTLQGSVHIYSDCLGALNKVKHLPPHRIPTSCKHSDILKTILIHCNNLSFERLFSHVDAHQDDDEDFYSLSLESRWNCAMDYGAKKEIWELDADNLPKQQPFPLEPICMYINSEKMTSDTGDQIRFQAHYRLAREVFYDNRILDPQQFEEVDWWHVHNTLHEVPRMFQIWACKQVMDIAGTNYNQWIYNKEKNPMCPSCNQVEETCEHVLKCREAGRVEALGLTIDGLSRWLQEKHTDPVLRDCLVRYARGRDGISMEYYICYGKDERYQRFALSQDRIGWRRFMKGMISKECRRIQHDHMRARVTKLSIDRWMAGLITKLMEVTHGQWLYRNVQVHDSVAGVTASLRKEEIQMDIECQQELGGEGLLEEDKYLLEVNLEDMETTSGERQEYWLLAIRAAREACRLKAQQADSNVNGRNTAQRRA